MKQLPITIAEIHVIPVPAATKNIRMRFGRYLTMVKPFSSSVDQFDEHGWELLGTCTKDDIDFDAAPLFENEGGMLNNKYALRSAIKSAGYYFVNPYGTSPRREFYIGSAVWNTQEQHRWKAAQQSVVEKLVIIKKVTPCKK